MKANGVILQNLIDLNLNKTPSAIRLTKEEGSSPFADKVTAILDQKYEARLSAESKCLAGELTSADTNLPVGFQRTVIREALSDLRILDIVQTLIDTQATGTTQIPYELRDASGIENNGIVYEGNPIHRASVSQEMELAYLLPMKLAFLISNEVMHFSKASQMDWDAFARNVESNARILRELIAGRILREMQRSADAYNAADETGEAFDGQLDGSTSIIKTTNFPIVRPYQQKDLQGTDISAEENPITVVLNDVTLSEFDGSGTQSAGTYYRVTNYNLGYIQLVDESGTPVTPADTGTNTLDYSYATNVAKFDLDNGTTEIGLHLNGLLRSIGRQKAVMLNDRFVTPDFMIMSPVLNNSVTDANQFTASNLKPGSELGMTGDLEAVKGIPAWSTNSPYSDMGDERIIMGQAGTVSYVVAKPFETGQPFEHTDASGKATGQKQAYGEELSVVKVPDAIRNRLTSVLAYSFSGR